MHTTLLEIFIIVLLLLLNGVFAMAELAVVSARKARLQQYLANGDERAQFVLELAANPNQFLSTIQIGITLIGILTGVFGGATLAEELDLYFSQILLLAPHSPIISFVIVVLGITYFSLIIGELIPKRIALNQPEKIAMWVARPLHRLSRIATPIVHLLSVSTDVGIRLLGIQQPPEPPITEEEIKLLIEQGRQSGIVEEIEQDMIEGVLRLGERQVKHVMTPRIHIDWLNTEDSDATLYQTILASQHAQFPLCSGHLDNVVGIVHSKDILTQHLHGQPFDLKTLLREPLLIPERMSALKVLDVFKKQGVHIALVVNEYGGLQGLLTHNDILEDIVGYVPLLNATSEPTATVREDGTLLVDGLLDIERFKEILGVEELPDEQSGVYQTVGGFVITQMGKIPKAGQSFRWRDYHIEVVDMDWRRVDKVLITLPSHLNPTTGAGTNDSSASQ